jgi:hypothetical protein
MNFKVKALVLAAVAAMSVSGAASAAMTNTASGDSSLVLTLLDRTAGVSATFDLGPSLSTFVQSANSSWSLSAGDYSAAWTSFNTAVAGNYANTVWAVAAGDSLGSLVGDNTLFTTSNLTTFVATPGSNLVTQLRNFDVYLNANNAVGTQATVANGASFVTSATGGAAYAGTSSAYGTTGKLGNVGNVVTAAFGTDLNVWNVVRSSATNQLAAATNTKLNVAGFNPYFNLTSTGAVNYVAAVAAVPEADTWAMMIAGLGMMGFVARRRRA